MSDIPNPLGAFDIFNSRFESKPTKSKKRKTEAIKKLFSKKIAKKLFGKKFALRTRAELTSIEPIETDKAVSKPKRPALQITWASSPNEIKEAQRLRYKVFADEMGANLPANPENLDIDDFDAYCDHLLIRDQETLKVVGTYRVLPPHKALEIGRLYSDSEFDLTRLNHLRPKMVELCRSCVHADYRSGAVIMAWWRITHFLAYPCPLSALMAD